MICGEGAEYLGSNQHGKTCQKKKTPISLDKEEQPGANPKDSGETTQQTYHKNATHLAFNEWAELKYH